MLLTAVSRDINVVMLPTDVSIDTKIKNFLVSIETSIEKIVRKIATLLRFRNLA